MSGPIEPIAGTVPMPSERVSATYADAGVNVDEGERAVELMKASIAGASRSEVVGDVGGFVGLFDASALLRYRRPLLATSTDGVGTKVAVAWRLNRHDTIGIDLVAMVVDDLVVCGAEPLFLTDYIATGKVVPERISAIVAGIAEGCRQAGCALIGGETAEHPGLLGVDEYDVAGAGTGVVEADELLGPHRVEAGDVVIAMRSSGLHSNGYSLARHVLLTTAGLALDAHVDVLGRTLGEELLEPTRIYALDVLDLARAAGTDLHAMSHVTGGGIAANLARVLPENMAVDLDRATWTPQPIFSLIAGLGHIETAEMEKTFNMGIGMIAVTAQAYADDTLARLAARGIDAWVSGNARARRDGEVGDVVAKGGHGGAVTMLGAYA